MRKINAANVRSRFQASILEIEAALVDVRARQATRATQKLLAESSLLSAMVLWESFVSDLVVAYVNNDTSGFEAHVNRKLNAFSSKEFGVNAFASISCTIKTHLNAEEVRSLLDKKGYNVTFADAADLISKASEWLSLQHAARFASLSAADQAFLDACHAVRNWLAHRSRASKKRMTDALQKPTLAAALRYPSSTVHDVGAFLTADPSNNGTSRITLYLQELRAISAKL
jgi:hypothetical protein